MLLKNCKIVTPKRQFLADILVEEGKIADIGMDLHGKDVIDIRGKPVIPGMVDIHVHMRDFQQRHKEDFVTGSEAALAGGVTTFIDMPNTLPPITDERTLERRLRDADAKSHVDFGVNFGITPSNLESAKSAKPNAYKIYMDGTLGEIRADHLQEIFRGVEGLLAFHAEDGSLISKNPIEEFIDHARARGPPAELAAVEKLCSLARRYKKRIHLCHLSLGDSLNYLNEYTTCEVTPHHLFLDEGYLEEVEGFAKTNPPLRKAAEPKALLLALKAGRINAVASDHAPHTVSEKDAGPNEAPSGIPNLEVTLRLLLDLVNRGVITLNRLVEVACENPARIYGLRKGKLEIGYDADLLVLDLKKNVRIESDEFRSKAKYTPFEGRKVMGDVRQVFLRGEIAYEDGDVAVSKGFGARAELS